MKIVTAMSLVASLAVSSAFALEGTLEVVQKVESSTSSRTEASVFSAESLSKKITALTLGGEGTYNGPTKVVTGALMFGPDIKKILEIDPAIESILKICFETVTKKLASHNINIGPIDINAVILGMIPVQKEVMKELIIEKKGIVDLNGCDLEVERFQLVGKLINTGHRDAIFISPVGRITVPAK